MNPLVDWLQTASKNVTDKDELTRISTEGWSAKRMASAATAMAQEERKHESKAKQPWPTKAELSKYPAKALEFKDSEDRHYYVAGNAEYDREDRAEWVTEQMAGYPAGSVAYWVRLPVKTTMGGMPEESTKITVTNTRSEFIVLRVSEMTGRKQRGTGFVILIPDA